MKMMSLDEIFDGRLMWLIAEDKKMKKKLVGYYRSIFCNFVGSEDSLEISF